MFRISLGVSLAFASGLLLPFIALSGYELLSSDSDLVEPEWSTFSRYKDVSCAIFHISLSSTVFSLLGSVIERWITISGLDPTDYLEKSSSMMSTPGKTRRRRRTEDSNKKKSDKCYRKCLVMIYLILAWTASIAFGILCVLHGKVRFLLFGEFLTSTPEVLQFSSLVQIPRDLMMIVTVFYIVFLFVPLIILILSSAVTLCYLFKIQSNAKKIDSYDEAKFRSASSIQPNQEVPLNHKLLQLTRSDSRTERDDPRRLSTRLSRDDRRSSTRTADREERMSRNSAAAEYSHKTEHERQVTLNCQETELNGIQTDSIQVSSDPVAESNHESNAPLPPDWLKFSSLTTVRYSDNSAIQVVDLASSSVSVSIDSARCYFGETNETRSTLIVATTVSLFLLPLCALLAIDVFAGRNSIFREGTYEATLHNTQTFSPELSLSLGAGFLALFLFGGLLPFFLLHCTSRLFRKAAKRICCGKEKQDKKELVYRHQNTYSNYVSNPKKNKKSKSVSSEADQNGNRDAPRSSRWSTKRTRSLDIEGWRPEERPTSEAFPESRLDIDKRFELDENDE